MEIKVLHRDEISFKSYVWDTRNDIIGSGATSKVYKARCMTTGNLYAVKVFDENARRNTVIQQRELDLLSKINHKNVVKLVDKDDEVDRFNRYLINAIVMEYCNGSSLATIIEKPENYYGLQQDEYLIFLKHITDGMRELNRLNIAHRDVKPNNILLQILPNGEHIYKLTDFGAAKEIESEELFNSIVGTEEYLHPGLYQKAFYRNASGSKFKSDVDLWSIGVTLYHTATGVLPFRAYGGRSNHDGMLNILKSKKSGQISGIQRRPYGPIEYSTKLPKTCELSDNLQEILIPMLAGLMETDPKLMWSFEKFFQYSHEITERVSISCIDVNKCELFETSFKPEQKLGDLVDKITLKTELDADSQLLVYNNLFLNTLVTNEQNIDTYPLMNDKNPLVIFSLNNKLVLDKTKVMTKKAPETLRLSITTLSELYGWCKQLLADLYVVNREIHKYSQVIDVLKSSAITCKLHISEMKLKQQNLLEKFKYTIKNLKTKMSISKIYDNILPQLEKATTSSSTSDSNSLKVDKLCTEINEYERQINFLSKKIENPRNLETLMKDLVTIKCKSHIDSIVSNVQQTFEDLYKERDDARRTNDRDRLLSKLNTFQLTNLKNVNEDTQELYERTFKVHFFEFITKYANWLNDLVLMKKEVNEIEKKLLDYGKKLEVLQKNIDNDSEPKAKKIDDLLSSLVKMKNVDNNNSNFDGNNNRLQSNKTNNLSSSRQNLNKISSSPENILKPNPFLGFEALYYTDLAKSDDSNGSDSLSMLTNSFNEFSNMRDNTDKLLDHNNELLRSACDKIETLVGGKRF